MRVLVVDTETTGLPDFKLPADHVSQPRLCSISMGLYEDGECLRKVTSLVRPLAWPDEIIRKSANAFAINGLSIDLLIAKGEPLAEVLDQFELMALQADGIAGYSLAFDEKILRGELRRMGRQDLYGIRPTCDVMRMVNRHLKRSRTKLVEAVELMLGIHMEDAHSAEADMVHTAKLFRWFEQASLVEWKQKDPKPRHPPGQDGVSMRESNPNQENEHGLQAEAETGQARQAEAQAVG